MAGAGAAGALGAGPGGFAGAFASARAAHSGYPSSCPGGHWVANGTLRALGLAGNRAGDAGAKAVARCVTPRMNSDGSFTAARLRSLDVSENGVGPEGLHALADALDPNRWYWRAVSEKRGEGNSGNDGGRRSGSESPTELRSNVCEQQPPSPSASCAHFAELSAGGGGARTHHQYQYAAPQGVMISSASQNEPSRGGGGLLHSVLTHNAAATAKLMRAVGLRDDDAPGLMIGEKGDAAQRLDRGSGGSGGSDRSAQESVPFADGAAANNDGTSPNASPHAPGTPGMMPGNAPGDATMADAAAIQRAFSGTRDGSSPGWTTPPAPAPSPALAVPAEIRALGVRKLDATRNDADASARARFAGLRANPRMNPHAGGLEEVSI